MSEQFLTRFEELACEKGAVGARIIKADSIVVEPWVLFKCKYGCEHYGKYHCCPPNTPTPQETKELIACYETALLFQCRENRRPGEFIFDLEREIFLAGYHKAIGLSAGRCRLCEECNLDQCTKPRQARPSMEACGISIFDTVRANDFHIQVLTDRDAVGTWYGLVLIK